MKLHIKNIFQISFIVLAMLGATVQAQVTSGTVRVLQINLYSWFTMDTKKNPPPVLAITSQINTNNYDFVTTQENDFLLTDPRYQLNQKYALAGLQNDASIFYDTSRWDYITNSWQKIAVSSDGGGSRVAVLSRFKNRLTGKFITVATTHLCIAWGGHIGCKNGSQEVSETTAHTTDANTIGSFISRTTDPSEPVVLSGDMNSFQDSVNQAISIENALRAFNLFTVKNNTQFIGPTFGNLTVDFVYTNKNLTIQNASLYSQNNPSDHKGIDVSFSMAGDPAVDLALRKQVSSSSAKLPASNAVDGDKNTRWESAWGVDPSWLQVDLSKNVSLSLVSIAWEAANAANYQILGSRDGNSWTILATRAGGTFGNRTDSVPVAGQFRYVRMLGTKRSVGNNWGYSIYSMKIFSTGTPSSAGISTLKLKDYLHIFQKY